MRISLITGLVLAFVVFPLTASAQGPSESVCGTDDPLTRDHLHDFLSSPRHLELRSEVGLDAVDPERLLHLEGPADASVCARLRKRLPKDYRVEGESASWIARFYRVADRYLTVLEWKGDPDDEILETVPASLYVYDRNFGFLGKVLNL